MHSTPSMPEALTVSPPQEMLAALDRGDAGPPPFSARILDFGFVAGIVLAAMCLLLSAYYLQQFLTATNEGVGELLKQQPASLEGRDLITMGISARLVMARLALRSCGVFVGLSFGFLGFSLFLIGVRGVIDANVEHANSTLTLARLSPGVFVIFCATVLIALCVTLSTPFEYTQTTRAIPDATATSNTGAPSKPDAGKLSQDTQH